MNRNRARIHGCDTFMEYLKMSLLRAYPLSLYRGPCNCGLYVHNTNLILINIQRN